MDEVRVRKVKETLYNSAVPMSAYEISLLIHFDASPIANDLIRMTKDKLAFRTKEWPKLYRLTDEGREDIQHIWKEDIVPQPPTPVPVKKSVKKPAAAPTPPTPISLQQAPASKPVNKPTEGGSTMGRPMGAKNKKPEVSPENSPKNEPLEDPNILRIPTQADQFRAIGEAMGVGGKKGETSLTNVMYYLEKTADFKNLNSIWNGLTKMGIGDSIKMRWLEIYAKSVPGQKIPEDLKEKLESTPEDKLKISEDAPLPKPKRFSVLNGQVIGNPEGDFNFTEAQQEAARQKGASPEQATLLTSMITNMVEMGKAGPELAMQIFNSMLGMLSNKGDGVDPATQLMLSMVQGQQTTSQKQQETMQTMLLGMMEQKHSAEIEGIKALIANKPSNEPSEALRMMNLTIESLKEQLHNQQLVTLQEQNRAMFQEIKQDSQSQINLLKQELLSQRGNSAVDSKLSLMGKFVDAGVGELKGLRSDLKPIAESVVLRGIPLPKPRSEAEKRRFSEGVGRAIESQSKLQSLADELWSKK